MDMIVVEKPKSMICTQVTEILFISKTKIVYHMIALYIDL